MRTGSEQCDGENCAGDCSGCKNDMYELVVISPTESTCIPICGDDFVANGEECDDSNVISGDGCSDTCQVELGWTCTQTMVYTPPARNLQATASVCEDVCGDNLAHANGHECDDDTTATGGVPTNHDGCDEFCQFEAGWNRTNFPWVSVCGDGYVT